jgi:hypothetical protein
MQAALSRLMPEFLSAVSLVDQPPLRACKPRQQLVSDCGSECRRNDHPGHDHPIGPGAIGLGPTDGEEQMRRGPKFVDRDEIIDVHDAIAAAVQDSEKPWD